MNDAFTLFDEMQIRASVEHFQKDMLNSVMMRRKEDLQNWLIQEVIKENTAKEGIFAEFGVYKGVSINLFAKRLARHKLHIHGFDAFEGIEENWDTDRLTGRYSLKGKAPEVEPNVELHVGWVQDTLPAFLKKCEGKKFSFIHMDMDTYTPTRFALERLVPHIGVGTVILFDELHGYPHWSVHEFKALSETIDRRRYDFLAFGLQQAAIRIIR